MLYYTSKGVRVMKNQTFGRYIAQLREEKEISQRGLANKSGLTNSTISRIESDLVKPDIVTLEKLAQALEVDKSLLLTKCGYSEIPEEFIVIARKTSELTESQRAEIYHKFNETIDNFLQKFDEEDD